MLPTLPCVSKLEALADGGGDLWASQPRSGALKRSRSASMLLVQGSHSSPGDSDLLLSPRSSLKDLLKDLAEALLRMRLIIGKDDNGEHGDE